MLQYYGQGLATNISRKIGDDEGVVDALIGSGGVYHAQSRFDMALKYLNEGSDINRRIGDERGVGRQLLDIGIVLTDQGRNDEALPYYY